MSCNFRINPFFSYFAAILDVGFAWMNKIKTLIFCLTIFASLFGVQGQSLSDLPSDLSNFRTESLTDDQILRIKTGIEERGLTLSQLEQFARARGISQLEWSKLRRRIETTSDASLTNNNSSALEGVLFQDEDSIVFDFDEVRAVLDSISEDDKRIFGYELFNNENLTFAPGVNVSITPDYVLGPGDGLLITIWGASQQTYQQSIRSNGTIYIDAIGPITVSGLTLDKAV